jgi:hypothetical protein
MVNYYITVALAEDHRRQLLGQAEHHRWGKRAKHAAADRAEPTNPTDPSRPSRPTRPSRPALPSLRLVGSTRRAGARLLPSD